MSSLLDVIIPVFLIIGFGYCTVWIKLFSIDTIDGLMKFTQNFAIPVLLFNAISKVDLVNIFNLNLFFSGDSGYTDLFKKIGNDYGPFDLAFIECGGYNSHWADVHMFPYEVVQANIDLRSEVFVPISWAKFDLSLHSWDEPIIRVTNEAKNRDQTIGSPMIGEIFDLMTIPTNHWWKNYQP